MGIKRFTDFVKVIASTVSAEVLQEIFKYVELSDIKNSVIILDCNAILFRYGSVKSVEIKASQNRLAIKRMGKMISSLVNSGNKVIVVTDMKDPETTIRKEIAPSIKSFKQRYKHLKTKPIAEKVVAEVEAEAGEAGEAVAEAEAGEAGEAAEAVVLERETEEVIGAKLETEKTRVEARSATQARTGVTPFSPTQGLIRVIEALCCEHGVDFYRCGMEADGLMAAIAHDAIVTIEAEKAELSQAEEAAAEAEKEVAKAEEALEGIDESGDLEVLETELENARTELAERVSEADEIKNSIASTYDEVYLMSEDSDMWVYDLGNTRILRTCSVQGRLKGGRFESADVQGFWKLINDPPQDIKYRIPLFMKCDYFESIKLIGPKKLLKVFTYNYDSKTIEKLFKLVNSRWTEGTSRKELIEKVVDVDAILEPVVKLGFTRESLKGLSLKDLKVMTAGGEYVYRSAADMDAWASSKLSAGNMDKYTTALFRFQEGADMERRCMRFSRPLAKSELKELVMAVAAMNIDEAMFDTRAQTLEALADDILNDSDQD